MIPELLTIATVIGIATLSIGTLGLIGYLTHTDASRPDIGRHRGPKSAK